ncbi:unnamed protein product [Angiostrongylus costaricensis]|uniref:CX domain-containing protein n=1 Tax=Angiostrongylus costaricensis TaxID=334426 RepID=A0A0R3PBZ7_ANGCS|nr:unnamed protein product [Angiostrongylus costaricensis]
MEIALQEKSKGILYEGYTKSFRQCIFEEGDVVGKNERYEFRCDDDLECCGRTCCIPEAATIPLWLMIVFIILAAVLLLAILGTLLWLLAKRMKQRPKKVHVHACLLYPIAAGYLNDVSNSSKTGYTALNSGRNRPGGRRNDADDRRQLVYEQETYSTPDHLYGGYGSRFYRDSDNHRDFTPRRDVGVNGYGNTTYNGAGVREVGVGNDGGTTREIAIRDVRPDSSSQPHPDRWRDVASSRVNVLSDNDSVVRHGLHETVEESFKQEITYEMPRKRAEDDVLEKFIPSPMEEESLPKPKEEQIIQRCEDEISRALTFDTSDATPLNPQRAQLAFYRSQTEQIASYNSVE